MVCFLSSEEKANSYFIPLSSLWNSPISGVAHIGFPSAGIFRTGSLRPVYNIFTSH